MKAVLSSMHLAALTCLVLWAGSSARAQQSSGGGPNIAPDDPRRFPGLVEPNDPRPNKSRATISAQGREVRGLAPHTWTGVISPDVLPKLEWLNQTLEDAKKLRTIKDAQMVFDVRFPETVFVQVQLRHTVQGDLDSTENKAAIKAVQKRVLTSLKASEFYVKYVFETRPGIIGYVSREGLDKLGANLDVTGVCLDNEPIVRATEIIASEDLPSAPSDECANKPGVAEGKVNRDVYRALATRHRVRVSIALKSDSLPHLTEDRSTRRQRYHERKRAEWAMVQRVTSTLNADDFWLHNRYSGMFGQITEEGLRKLWNNPEVLKIGLPAREKTESMKK